jgi:hypothetical protein
VLARVFGEAVARAHARDEDRSSSR